MLLKDKLSDTLGVNTWPRVWKSTNSNTSTRAGDLKVDAIRKSGGVDKVNKPVVHLS